MSAASPIQPSIPGATVTLTSASGLPELKTPLSAGPRLLPSELPRSPLDPMLPFTVKLEESRIPTSSSSSSLASFSSSSSGNSAATATAPARTPITPPVAYTDFLKALSPAVSTPCYTGTSSSGFSDPSGRLTPLTAASFSSDVAIKKEKDSADNATTATATSTNNTKAQGSGSTWATRKLSLASAPLVPPSPFVRPPPIMSSRAPTARTPTTLKRLRIPQSPYGNLGDSDKSSSNNPSSATVSAGASRSSLSPSSAGGPAGRTPLSASPPKGSTTLRSPYSPTSWRTFGEAPRSAGGANGAVMGVGLGGGTGNRQAVSIRQVVTRTITYTSKPLDPAPRGKRRKVE